MWQGLCVTLMLVPQDYHHQHHGVRFKPGFGPYIVTDKDPSFRTCLKHFGPSEYTIMGVTAAVPSYLGFRVNGMPESHHAIHNL